MFRALQEELSKYSGCSPPELLQLLWRFTKLLLGAHPKPALAHSPARRTVITLSTVPSRIKNLRPALASLIDQSQPADEILLVLPHRSEREQTDYPLPEDLPPEVELLRCSRDWGPATKLIPALQREQGRDTLLIVVDDDNVYPRTLVENFLYWHQRYPESALGNRGWCLPPDLDWHTTITRYGTTLSAPEFVDVVTGTWGVAVRPEFFDEGVRCYEDYPEEAFYVDDIWFNGHLAKRGIKRLLIPGRLPPLPTPAAWRAALGSGVNADGHNNNRVIRAFEEYWR